MENIIILGSTGSVGKQVLDALRAHPNHYKVFGLAANDEILELKSQIEEFKPKIVSVGTKEAKESLSKIISGKKPAVYFGEAGLIQLATDPKADCLVVSTSGTVALSAVLKGIQHKKKILMANKESLVIAGDIINKALNVYKGEFLPLDSEHSAIFQCLQGENRSEIKNLILTCSGGPFRNWKKTDLKKVKIEQALNHPVWKMGAKVTIDSATLMNKGFEVLEAHYLFHVPLEKIQVLVHPEGIVHSLVEFEDGNMKALLSKPDMRFPIQYALFYPKRLSNHWGDLDLSKTPNLTFQKPDTETFPCLNYAYMAGKTGGTMPAALNFADEIAVEMFSKNKIRFLDIPKIIEKILKSHKPISNPGLKEILMVKDWVQKQLK
ncbi:MAG: 1-deoxy-D-xylulose-5-phosphate reductoisomerase [Candidatus Nealsonbacteria bacterium]